MKRKQKHVSAPKTENREELRQIGNTGLENSKARQSKNRVDWLKNGCLMDTR